MRLTIACMLVALLPLGPSAAAPPKPSAPQLGTQVLRQTCARAPQLANSGQAQIFRHPRQFPPSDLHHAVDRRVDNCPVPAIVRRNVGR